jgi:alanine racemase
MNMIMVDVTHIQDIVLEDEVVLLGTQGTESVSAEELAEVCQTINYDVVTRLGAHIPRFVIR